MHYGDTDRGSLYVCLQQICTMGVWIKAVSGRRGGGGVVEIRVGLSAYLLQSSVFHPEGS